MFEKQKADENERAAKRMMEKPQGRRYDAITDYHQRIQMGDEVHGYDAEAVSTWHLTFCVCSAIRARDAMVLLSFAKCVIYKFAATGIVRGLPSLMACPTVSCLHLYL